MGFGPPQLKEEIVARGEWAERFRSNFDHVLAERELTGSAYEGRTEISFDTDDEFYDYLSKLHRFLFSDGPIPLWLGKAFVRHTRHVSADDNTDAGKLR